MSNLEEAMTYECVSFDGWTEATRHGVTSYSRPYGSLWLCVSQTPETEPYAWLYGISLDAPGTGAYIISGRCSTKQEAMAACHFAKKP